MILHRSHRSTYRHLVHSIGLMVIGLGVWLTANPCEAQDPTPAGDELTLNTATDGSHRLPQVDHDADGNFVVVWHRDNTDYGNNYHLVQGRRFDAQGNPLGGEFLIDIASPDVLGYPDVAVGPEGHFVVVWQTRDDSDGTFDYDIRGQRYAANGAPQGPRFEVHPANYFEQTDPLVELQSNGNFVVVWVSGGEVGDPGASLRGRRFASNGSALGDDFQVNADSTFSPRRPALSLGPDGDFVVAWEQGVYSDTPGIVVQAVYGRRFASDGSPLGAPFTISDDISQDQERPAVAHDGDGEFLVVWDGFGGGLQSSIQGQRYQADGTPLGPVFPAGGGTVGDQTQPSVDMQDNGDFLVVWQGTSEQNNFENEDIHGLRFTSDGNPLGTPFILNTSTTGDQELPQATYLTDDRFLVLWASIPTGVFSTLIQGQIFCDPNCGVFADGFESGDSSAWSNSAGGAL